jgi:hypothetical protein
MVETASTKRKIISFHNDSTSLCGFRRKAHSEVFNEPFESPRAPLYEGGVTSLIFSLLFSYPDAFFFSQNLKMTGGHRNS